MNATGDYNENVCNRSCLSTGLAKVVCAIYQDIKKCFIMLRLCGLCEQNGHMTSWFFTLNK